MTRLARVSGRLKGLDKRRITLYVLLAAVILAPFLASLPNLAGYDDRNTVEANSLPELYVLAVEGLNLTVSSMSMLEEPPQAAYEYSKQAYDGLNDFNPVDVPGLLGNVTRSVEAYKTIALAGVRLYNSSTIILEAVEGGKSVIEKLRQCRIQEAIDEWKRIEPVVDEAVKTSLEDLNTLTSVDPGYLLSGEHRNVARSAITLLDALALDLERLKKIMNIIQDNADSLEKLCNGEATPEGGETALNVANLARGSHPASPMRIDMLRLYSSFSVLGSDQGLSSDSGGSRSGIGTGSGNGTGGSGAGYGVPPSDD